MSDLIKRSDAIKAIEDLPNAYNGWSDAYDKAYIIGTLEEVPSADRPQGEWIPKYEGSYLQRRMYCSVCGKRSGIGGIESNQRKPYCPNCGAKMDGERKEKSDE